MDTCVVVTPGPRMQCIATLDDLREQLQWAIELEHATLPSYLCALYSLDPARNPDASQVLTSVFVEEMLHLTLAANLLNAVGGRPRLDAPHLLPGYPRCLPHCDGSIAVSLLPFSVEAVELFMRIERPAGAGASDQCDGYATIGQFYGAIRHRLTDLCRRLGETEVFCGDADRQVTADLAYGGSGRIIAVGDLQTALSALDEIVTQGEGADHHDVWDGDRDMFHPERVEVGHFYRFDQLLKGRRYQPGDTPTSGPTGPVIEVDWDDAPPVRRDPRVDDHPPGHSIRIGQEGFNRSYCLLLGLLDEAFDGAPHRLPDAVHAMYGLKSEAERLMRVPTGDGLPTALPTFEYVAPELRS